MITMKLFSVSELFFLFFSSYYFFLMHMEEILIDCNTLSVSSAYRTAICKARRGGFKDTFAEDLLVPVFKVCALLCCFLFCIFILLLNLCSGCLWLSSGALLCFVSNHRLW